MQNNVSESQRLDALHAQLVDALRPETDHERSTLRWLRDTLSADGLAALVEMAERLAARPALDQLAADQRIGDERRGR